MLGYETVEAKSVLDIGLKCMYQGALDDRVTAPSHLSCAWRDTVIKGAPSDRRRGIKGAPRDTLLQL
jgi:hypothetical protein